MLAIGSTIGELTIVRELAVGGMGVLYLARDRVLDTQHVVKVLLPQFAQHDLMVQRFVNEGRAAAAVPHRNIIRVSRCAQLADGQWHIVMDYLDGGTLAAYAASHGGPMSRHDVLSIMCQVGNGLFAAHNRGVVHRDLKPENIFLVQREGNPRHVVILDFGISHFPERDGSAVTKAGMMAGTPAYMAPEQIRDLKSAGERADIYAMGVMLYQLLTGGWFPYQRDDETLADYCNLTAGQIQERQLTQTLVDPRRRFAALDERWANIICTALHPDPSRRQPTTQKLVLQLAEVTEGDAFSPSGVEIVREYAREILDIGNLLETVRATRVPAKPATTSRYQFGKLLGSGGMAEVLRGVSLGAHGFSRDVAIKRVLPGFSNVPQFAEMFIQEARIASKLLHNAIVQVFDFDRDPEGRLFLVMELVEGRDLNALRDNCLVPPSVIVYVMIEVLRALEYAHDLPVPTVGMRGVIHRDISPHNILLSWDGAVKLSDFGIAKAREATAATASDQIKGKVAYMSPEQANGEDLDGRSDLWACGVVLFELLTGRPLFVGTTQEALAQVFHRSIPSPSSLRADVPPDLEAITLRLLQRDLSARYSTAAEVIRDLSACQDMSPTARDQLVRLLAAQFPEALAARSSPDSTGVPSAPLMTSHPQDGVVTASAKPRPSGTPLMPRLATPTTLGSAAGQAVPGPRSRSRRWLALGVVGVGVAVGAIVAFAVTRGDRSEIESTPTTMSSSGSATTTSTPSITPAPPLPTSHVATVLPDASTALHVTIETQPPNATVIIDHERLGPSPVTIRTARGAHHAILATLDGYADGTASVAVDHDAQTFVLVLSAKPQQPVTRPGHPSTTEPRPAKRFNPNEVGGDD